MTIHKLKPLSMCDTNSYIVGSSQNNAVLIDAPADSDYILETIKTYNLTLKKILLTHGHFDHVGAVADLVDKTNCEVYIHMNDLGKLTNDEFLLTNLFHARGIRKFADAKPLIDGDIIKQDELEFKVIHTPGHTSGSVCYAIENNLFTGDTLFYRSMGRTDMPDGDDIQMLKSLRKLSNIEENYIVYPGHMKNSTLEDEKKYNPCITTLANRGF